MRVRKKLYHQHLTLLNFRIFKLVKAIFLYLLFRFLMTLGIAPSMYNFSTFKATRIPLRALYNFFENFTVFFFYGDRFSMKKCIYDVLDLGVSVSQKAVFKVSSPN